MFLGVDLIELKKARSFYREHKDRLGSFFSPKEVVFIRKSRRPYEGLAVVWAAKEAVFKTIAKPGLGFWTLKSIRVKPDARQPGVFMAECPEKIGVAKGLRIHLMRTRDYVVAKCAGNC